MKTPIAGFLLSALLAAPLPGQTSRLTENERLARTVLDELIATNTQHSNGSTTLAAEAMARHFRQAGFPGSDVEIVGPDGTKNLNLLVRYRGKGGGRPILLIGHLDVVEAKRDDWSMEPYQLNEKDGFFYGRGTSDVKGGVATLVAALLRMKQEGAQPERDLILALTAGEESGGDYNGIDWLVRNRPELAQVEYCLNVDSGEPIIQRGKLRARPIQVAEKVAFNVSLEVTNPGGHSSLPTPDNAIYRLAAGLDRLARFKFPAVVNDVTRGYFSKMATLDSGQTAKDMASVASTNPDPAALERLSASPIFNAVLRTTCTPTLLEGGHAVNALPQRAKATINCRMLPTDSAPAVEATIRRVIADSAIVVRGLSSPRSSPASALSPALVRMVEKVTAGMWAGIPVFPYMETGGTDGRRLREAGIPTFGVSGIAMDVDDVRAHGRDERIGVKQFYEGIEYIYRLVIEVSAGSKPQP